MPDYVRGPYGSWAGGCPEPLLELRDARFGLPCPLATGLQLVAQRVSVVALGIGAGGAGIGLGLGRGRGRCAASSRVLSLCGVASREWCFIGHRVLSVRGVPWIR